MRRKSDFLKKHLPLLLIVSLLLGVVAVTVKFAKSDTKTILASAFNVGTVNAETGKYEKSEKAIYTKDAFECSGLTVKRAFNTTSTYQIFWYNVDQMYIGCTDVLDEWFVADNIPEMASFARIAIYPSMRDKSGKDIDGFSVKFYDVASIAQEFTVTVLRDQTENTADMMAVARLHSNFSVAQAYAASQGKDVVVVRYLRGTVNKKEDVNYVPGYSFTAFNGKLEQVSAALATVTPDAQRDLYMFNNDDTVYKYAIKYTGAVNVQSIRVVGYGVEGDANGPSLYLEKRVLGDGVFEFSIPPFTRFFVVEVVSYLFTENTNPALTLSMYKYLPNTELCKNLYGG